MARCFLNIAYCLFILTPTWFLCGSSEKMNFPDATNRFVVDRHELTVTKEMLKGLQVVGQVDRKFIVTSTTHDDKRYFIVWDQHAVDERLRLEHLQRKFRQEMRHLKTTKLPNPLLITLFTGDATATHLAVREDLRKSLKMSGILCKIRYVDREMSIVVTDFPVDLLRKILRKPTLSAYLDLVKENVAKLALNFPKKDRLFRGDFFAQALASEACSRAVKFGDSLSPSMMRNMMVKLTQCDLPFQCAHGRPTLTVIKCDRIAK